MLPPGVNKKAYQINLQNQAGEGEQPATVSYNTKVFNREIMALRNEEEALLRFQNATRKREYNIDQLKYRPSMVDYTSVSAKKNYNQVAKNNANGKKATPSVRGMPTPSTLEPLEVNLDTNNPKGRQSVKRQSSMKDNSLIIPSANVDVSDLLDEQHANSASDEGDNRSAFKNNPVLPAIPEKGGDVNKILRDKSLIRGV